MTKKFWESWRNRVNETRKIILANKLQVFGRDGMIEGCLFDSKYDRLEFIQITYKQVHLKIARYNGEQYLYTETFMIDRYHIKTVLFHD